MTYLLINFSLSSVIVYSKYQQANRELEQGDQTFFEKKNLRFFPKKCE